MFALAFVTFAPILAQADPAARDLKALEGIWEAVTHKINGKKASEAGYYSPKTIVISSGKIDLHETGKADKPITVDPAGKPKAIDVYIPGAMKFKAHLKGIYSVDGDDLKLCLPLSTEANRPARFTSENSLHLFILRRKP